MHDFFCCAGPIDRIRPGYHGGPGAGLRFGCGHIEPKRANAGKSCTELRDIIGANAIPARGALSLSVCRSPSVVKKPHDPPSVARSPIGAPSAHAAGRMGDMDWWRSRRRRGAGLGLLALLVQIALSFGHLHLQDIRPASAQFAATATQPAQVDPGPARRHVPPGLPDDDCPLCIAVHMAASGLLSVPPAMNIPGGFIHIAPPPIAAR